MKVTKNDLRLTNGVADAKERRPMLSNVLLRDGKLIAADGFLLVGREADLDENEPMAWKPEVLLAPAMLKTARTKNKTDMGEVTLELDDTLKVTVKDARGLIKDPLYTFRRPSEVGTFPSYNKAVVVAEKKAHVAVSLKNLRKLLSCLPEEGMVRIGVGTPSEPVEFHVGKPEDDRPIRAFLMPMFVPWDEHKWANEDPKWIKPTESMDRPGEGEDDDLRRD